MTPHSPKSPSPPSSNVLRDDILFKLTTLTGKKDPTCLILQLVIPSSLIPTVLQLIHDFPHAAHPGKEMCLAQARLKYFWLFMKKDIDAHIDQSHVCTLHKGNLHKPVPIPTYPVPAQPWDNVAIDLLKLPCTDNVNQYLFVAIDNFSRFSVLVPIHDKFANSVAKALLRHVICPFTTPNVLLSDNDTEFVKAVLSSLCNHFNMKTCTVLPYRPSANGLVERQNRKVLNTLHALVSSKYTLWDT